MEQLRFIGHYDRNLCVISLDEEFYTKGIENMNSKVMVKKGERCLSVYKMHF